MAAWDLGRPPGDMGRDLPRDERCRGHGQTSQFLSLGIIPPHSQRQRRCSGARPRPRGGGAVLAGPSCGRSSQHPTVPTGPGPGAARDLPDASWEGAGAAWHPCRGQRGLDCCVRSPPGFEGHTHPRGAQPPASRSRHVEQGPALAHQEAACLRSPPAGPPSRAAPHVLGS